MRSGSSKKSSFPPATPQELEHTGWGAPDVVLISGDAYVDHPAFGAAVIARCLEAAGFKVAVLPQPDWRSVEPFRSLGKPRLFFAITGGNVDSMVANYSAFRNRRRIDSYSPEGKAGMRPNRASIVYANRAREAFPEVPIVLGGVEASLRRLSHYDYWEDKMRRSILLDAKADLLLYGMAEESVVALARALAEGRTLEEARRIRGACYLASESDCLAPESEVGEEILRLPGFDEVQKEPLAFTRSYRVRHRAADPHANQRLAEPYGKRWVIQEAPCLPLSPEKLDEIYELPFTRAIHPCYGKSDVPALRTVLTSMVTHRGCFGGCSFCSIGFHQGRIIQDRSQASLLREVERLTRDPRFKGTLNDLAGPSANMYGYTCKRTAAGKACKRPNCLHPEPCKRLTEGYDRIIGLLRAVRKVPGVKHAFIQSGIRHDLTLCDKGLAYLEEVVNHHVSGTLKVAPEHSEKKVLDLMRKPDFALYEEFKALFDRMNRQAGLRQYLVSYFISAHPGCGMKEMKALKDKLKRMGLKPEQIQDYTPLPGTEASVMFATGLDPFTDRPLFVARTDRERRDQRRVIQPPGAEGRATDWES